MRRAGLAGSWLDTFRGSEQSRLHRERALQAVCGGKKSRNRLTGDALPQLRVPPPSVATDSSSRSSRCGSQPCFRKRKNRRAVRRTHSADTELLESQIGGSFRATLGGVNT